MTAFIEAVSLLKTYHVGKTEVPALRGVSFGIQKAEFVSVAGPSVCLHTNFLGASALEA
jgi:putative ABC transport system ATP-binding protein